ncbi:hypothetical protein EDB83DRAFT_2313704 [Lactarius deliciosus]|nr:hypothetical protein EDB83DRAFT_2313704 [Lactarius deliciosus]
MTPPPGLRSAPPAHPSHDSSARRSGSGCIVPCSMYPLHVHAALPLTHSSSRARRVTPGRAEVAHPTRRGLGWASCIPPGAQAWRLAWPTWRGGHAVPPLANEGRTWRSAWGWGGVARTEEDWAVRAIPPLACVDGAARGWTCRPSSCKHGQGGARGMGWRGLRGWVSTPSLLSRMRAGKGGAHGAGQVSPALKGTGVGPLSSVRWQGGPGQRGEVGYALACPLSVRTGWRSQGGREGAGATHPFRVNRAVRTGERGPAFRADKVDVGKRGARGRRAHANVVAQTRGKGPCAPYLRAKGRQRSMLGTEWGKGKGKGKGIGLSSSSFQREWVGEEGEGRGAHDDTGRTGPPQSPSAQAMPAQPHAPCLALPAYVRGGTATPAHPTRSALPAFARGRTACPAPRRPIHTHKGRDGAHSPVLLGTGDTTPTPRAAPRPALIRERRDGAPTPPRGPRQPPAHARGRVGTSTPSARATPVAFTHPAMPAHPGGCKRPSPAPSAQGVLPQPSRGLHAAPKKRYMQGGGPHAREGGTWNGGQCNPSPSGEWRSRAKGVQAGWSATQVGESRTNRRAGTSEHGCVMNKVKGAGRGCAHEWRAPPTPVDRLRKIHVK